MFKRATPPDRASGERFVARPAWGAEPVDLSGAATNDFALCVLGLDLLETPVPALGCPCPIFVTPTIVALSIVDGAGAAQVSVPMPPSSIGTTLWAQWLTLNASLTGCQSTAYGGRFVP